MNSLRPLAITLRSGWHLVLLWGAIFAIAAQFLQLTLLVLRFGDLPNYIINYDWISHVMLIIRSTPAIGDVLPIVFEEWWIEIGFMNYDYGNGISEWSLNVIPSRLVMLFFMGGMITVLVLLRSGASCSMPTATTATAAAGMGTVLMCMTSAAMSWVVCCATPSWVVGLAMLGLGVSTSLALEDLGPTLFWSGFVLLMISLFLVSRTHAQNMEAGVPGDNVSDLGKSRQYITALWRV